MVEILRLKFGQYSEAEFWVTCDKTSKNSYFGESTNPWTCCSFDKA